MGGCGHGGLPLAVAFAERGARVASYDIGAEAVEAVNDGRLPFREPAAELPLRRAGSAGRLVASADPAVVGAAEHVIVIIRWPDQHAPGPPEPIPCPRVRCSRPIPD